MYPLDQPAIELDHLPLHIPEILHRKCDRRSETNDVDSSFVARFCKNLIMSIVVAFYRDGHAVERIRESEI